MAGKIRGCRFNEIIRKLSRRKRPLARMDSGDYRREASYRANNANKRRAENKLIDPND